MPTNSGWRWKAIQDHVLWRDAKTCQLYYPECGRRATHVIKTREGKRLDLQLQAVCGSCRDHHRKAQREQRNR